MAFSDPVVGGDTLIRSAIQSPNYSAAGEAAGTGWRIGNDGNAQFNNVTLSGEASGIDAVYQNITAKNSFTYKQQELSDILWNQSWGNVAYGKLAGSTSRVATSPSLTPVLEIGFIAQGQRAYLFKLNPMRVKGSSDGLGTIHLVTLTTDGTTPQTTSLQVFMDQIVEPYNNRYEGVHAEVMMQCTAAKGSTQVWRMLYCFQNVETGAYTSTMDLDAPEIYVMDIGPVLSNVGVDRYVAPSGSGATTYDNTWSFTSMQSYQSNGNLSIATNANVWAYQGDGSAVGNPGGPHIGLVFFDSAAIRTALAGATIQHAYITAHDNWSYSTSGVEAVVGTHNSDPTPGFLPSVNGDRFRYFVARGNTFTSGDVPWLGNELRDGTSRGIAFGFNTAADLAHYGNFDSCSIRIIYSK